MPNGKLRVDRESWIISEFFLKNAYLNIHDTFKTENGSSQVFPKLVYFNTHDSLKGNWSFRSPPAIVSSESVDRKVRRDPYSSETSEELLNEPTKVQKLNKKWGLRTGTGDPYHSEVPEWSQEFKENLVCERVPEHRDSLVSFQELSLKLTRSADLGKHSVYTHFPKDRNCEICQRTKITRPVQKTYWQSRTQWKLWISKQSSICSRCARLRHPMDPVSIRERQKLLRKREGACKSSWSRIGSLKSFTLTIPWNLAKLVKIFPGNIVRLHHTDQKQMGLLREQCAEWQKAPLRYCCCEEYVSQTRKSHVKWLRRKQQLQQEQWGQVWDQLQHHHKVEWREHAQLHAKHSTPMTTFTHTLAWCTSCAELAHSAHSFTPGDVISHLIGSSPEQTLCHPRSYPWAHLFDFSLSTSTCFFLSFSVYFLQNELFPELDNPIVMASQRYSADIESEDMWVTLPNNADWDCFKILTLQEILKIQNPLLEEHCAFLEVINLFQ